MKRVYDSNYVYIKCNACDHRAKLAKNKLAYWNAFEFLEDFLIKHRDCDPADICLIWE